MFLITEETAMLDPVFVNRTSSKTEETPTLEPVFVNRTSSKIEETPTLGDTSTSNVTKSCVTNASDEPESDTITVDMSFVTNKFVLIMNSV